MSWDFSFGDALSLASTGFDIYSGIQSMSLAEDMYDIAAGSADQQDEIAKAQWEIAEPVVALQADVALSDANAYLATADQRAALDTTQMGLQQDYLDAYGQYMPGIQDQYYQNMANDLQTYSDTQGTRDAILQAQYANQLTGTGLNASLLESQQADLDLYNANRGIMQDYYTQASEGLDIGEQIGLAKTDVAQAFAGQQAATNRSMARMGVNPNSGAFADQERLSATDQAKATASAANNARINTEQINYSRLQDATNSLKGSAPAGYATSVSTPTNTGLGLMSGNTTQATALSGLNAANSALTGYGSSASTMSNLAGTAAQAAGTSFTSAGSGIADWSQNSSWLSTPIFS